MTERIWSSDASTDTSRAGMNERITDYMARTNHLYFVAVREVLENWIQSVPSSERHRLKAELRSDDAHFMGAFWELYLHESYRRAGYPVEFHPPTTEGGRSPDFLVHADPPFYLEAHATHVAVDRRLAEVQEALRAEQITLPYRVAVSHRAVGPASPSIAKLKRDIVEWLKSIDYHAALARYASAGVTGTEVWIWREGGWEFEVRAIPTTTTTGHRDLMSMWGAAEGTQITNHRSVQRALERKGARYGKLNWPYAIAHLFNTEFVTSTGDIERALYGVHLPHPPEGMPSAATLQEPGFWIDRRGWRRRAVSQVITASSLTLGNLEVAPLIWPHPDSAVPGVTHPESFRRVSLGPLHVGDAMAPASFLQLPNTIQSRDDRD